MLALSSILFRCTHATRIFFLHFSSACFQFSTDFPVERILLGEVTFLYTLRKFRRKLDSVSNSGKIFIYIYIYCGKGDTLACTFFIAISQITMRCGEILTIIKLKYKHSSTNIFLLFNFAFNIYILLSRGKHESFYVFFLYSRRGLNNIAAFYFIHFTLF